MDQQSLLRWGIENSAPGSLVPLAEEVKAGKRPDLNTDVLRAIMGTTDADRMLECIRVIEGTYVNRDEEETGAAEASTTGRVATKEDKLTAWTDLEMLIEDIDNANDLKNMKLWPPIVKYLSDEDEEIVTQACWVCGTAVQNNPKAQEAFLELNPLPIILPLVTSTTISAATRSKAMYCLSSTLKHSEAAVATFSSLNGWSTLNQALQDPSVTIRSKAAFLLSQLILQSPSPSTLVSSLRASSVLTTLIDSLSPSSAIPTGPDGDVQTIDVDYKEKALRALVNVVATAPDALVKDEKRAVQDVAETLEDEAEWSVEDVGLADEEWASFKTALSS